MVWILAGIAILLLIIGEKFNVWAKYVILYCINKEKISEIHILNDGGGKLGFLMILGALTDLPDNVLSLMKEQSLYIVYSSNKAKYQEESGFDDFAGYFDKKDNMIFIWDDGFWGNLERQVKTIVHEIGHFVDFHSGEEDFRSIEDIYLHAIHLTESFYYSKYIGGYYYIESMREFFAESFAEIIIGNKFKKECPLTTAYINKLIEEL